MLLSVVLLLLVSLGLRHGSRILAMPATYDEQYITVPIINLLQQGWMVATAIDFEETKGPGLIWLYALAGEVTGESLNDLRLISLALFVFGAVPLLDLARRCGVHGPSLAAIAGLYALLPYNIGLGQMVMSEPAYVMQMLVVCWFFLADDTPHSDSSNRSSPGIWRLVAFALALSILLHNRVHGAALAAAVCLVALERDGWRGARPWIIACIFAVLSRLPLVMRWGGLVSPRFQGIHALGASFDGQTYLLSTYAPLVTAFIWPGLVRDDCRARRWMIAAGAGVGLLLGIVASPSVPAIFSFEGGYVYQYAGVIASTVQAVTSEPLLQAILVGGLAALGGAGLGALGAIAWSSTAKAGPGVIDRLQFWLLTVGLVMYAASAAPVFDRYVLGWGVLLPLVWWRALPRWLLLIQAAGLCAIGAMLCARWLF